jgi:hypothetical protein
MNLEDFPEIPEAKKKRKLSEDSDKKKDRWPFTHQVHKHLFNSFYLNLIPI